MNKYFVTVNIQPGRQADARFEAVEASMREAGYRNALVANNGAEVELPPGTHVQEVDANSHSLMQMRVDKQREISAMFHKHDARGCFYLAVSTDWDWGYGER